MDSTSSASKEMRPKLIKRAGPGWLATTPDGANLCFGVIGSTESDAREKFSIAAKKWLCIPSQSVDA